MASIPSGVHPSQPTPSPHFKKYVTSAALAVLTNPLDVLSSEASKAAKRGQTSNVYRGPIQTRGLRSIICKGAGARSFYMIAAADIYKYGENKCLNLLGITEDTTPSLAQKSAAIAASSTFLQGPLTYPLWFFSKMRQLGHPLLLSITKTAQAMTAKQTGWFIAGNTLVNTTAINTTYMARNYLKAKLGPEKSNMTDNIACFAGAAVSSVIITPARTLAQTGGVANHRLLFLGLSVNFFKDAAFFRMVLLSGSKPPERNWS